MRPNHNTFNQDMVVTATTVSVDSVVWAMALAMDRAIIQTPIPLATIPAIPMAIVDTIMDGTMDGILDMAIMVVYS